MCEYIAKLKLNHNHMLNINNGMSKSNIKFIAMIPNNLLIYMCVLFYESFVCIYAYANVYFKTTITKQTIKIILLAFGFPRNNIISLILLAGVPSSRATFGFPQYCASTFVRFGCTRHASFVDTKPKKTKLTCKFF